MKLFNKKTRTLLEKIKMDYNHPWPNEDKLTKLHRCKILKEIELVLLK